MVPLYTLLLTALAGLRKVLSRRAVRIERKYARAALEAQKLAQATATKPGNGAVDPFLAAKRSYELGRVVDTRDRLEAKFLAAQGRADAVSKLVARLRAYQGRTVPYLLGVVDVGLVLAALHYLGLPHGLTADTLKEWVETLRL